MERGHEFIQLCRHLMLASGSHFSAARAAECDRMPRVAAILKSLVEAGSTSSLPTLVDYSMAVNAFFQTLIGLSAFDTMLASMLRVPFEQKLGVVSAGFSGTSPSELDFKAVSSLTLADGGQLHLRKSVSLCGVSAEILKLSGNPGSQILAQELRNAVAIATDSKFVSIITNGLTTLTASGKDYAAARSDLEGLLSELEIRGGSRLFVLTTPRIVKQWAMKGGASGRAFDDLTPSGGTVFGMPVVPSDGIPAGEVIVADATGIAANSETMAIDVATQATIQLNTSPGAGRVRVFSVWPSRKNQGVHLSIC
jgi:hypothetical protein